MSKRKLYRPLHTPFQPVFLPKPIATQSMEKPMPVVETTSVTWDKLVKELTDNFKDCSDFSIRQYSTSPLSSTQYTLLYLETLVDKSFLQHSNIELVTQKISNGSYLSITSKGKSSLPGGVDPILSQLDVKTDVLSFAILSGKVVILLENLTEAYSLDCAKTMERSISEPLLESVNRGPRDGFTEALHTNVALIRQRLKDPSLKVRTLLLGKRTQTEIAMLFIDDIADKTLVDNVYGKLSSIDTDGILETSYIEEYLEETPFSPFPQVDHTERPDKVVSNLLEGRIAIMVHGSPFCSIVPALFVQFFQSPEDYYQRSIFSSFVRLFRYASSFVSISLPGFYLSSVSFHSQLIPSKLIELLLHGREQLPFPAVIEVLLMLSLLDLMQEASSRLLGRVGQAAGIVGSIVLGQAAIAANIAAPTTVVVIATTYLSSYVLPSYTLEFSFRLIRYAMCIVSSLLGIYGFTLLWLYILIHLCSIQTSNIPYLSPLIPLNVSDLKDSFIRISNRKMKRRPMSIRPQNLTRSPIGGNHDEG